MKRRQFFRRIAAAATAFVVAPGVFKALPAAQNVRKVVVAPKVVPFWFQTTRHTRCIDAAYAQFLTRMVETNGLGPINQPDSFHRWCETPVSPSYADFKARLDAARKL